MLSSSACRRQQIILTHLFLSSTHAAHAKQFRCVRAPSSHEFALQPALQFTLLPATYRHLCLQELNDCEGNAAVLHFDREATHFTPFVFLPVHAQEVSSPLRDAPPPNRHNDDCDTAGSEDVAAIEEGDEAADEVALSAKELEAPSPAKRSRRTGSTGHDQKRRRASATSAARVAGLPTSAFRSGLPAGFTHPSSWSNLPAASSGSPSAASSSRLRSSRGAKAVAIVAGKICSYGTRCIANSGDHMFLGDDGDLPLVRCTWGAGGCPCAQHEICFKAFRETVLSGAVRHSQIWCHKHAMEHDRSSRP